jgi:hypothetical protein
LAIPRETRGVVWALYRNALGVFGLEGLGPLGGGIVAELVKCLAFVIREFLWSP